MKFPVDLLADVSQTEMERLANDYMNNLLYSNPDSPEHLTLSDSTQVTIDISSVGFLPLYGSSDKHKILALFCASEPFTAVALYLLDRWWTVDDILKTADPARDGAVEVETVGERIVLYILNRVIYRAKEMSSEELPFLCHGEVDHAKVQWNNGEAVGFYSVKPSGSFCNYFSTRSFQLPVMDSIFVRKCQRGKGFGLQMLEDFVLSFKEDCLGLRYPLTKSMYKVCEKYLCQYPGDTDLLWEVESIGGPNQRINIARKIQAMDQRAVSKNQSFTEESLVITEITEEDVVMEAITTQIKEAQTMECTVEIVEEMTVLNAIEADVPLTARGRSSGSKQRKMAKTIAEDKSEKVIRIEDIEAETPGEEHVSALQKTSLPNVSELVPDEGMFGVGQEKQGEDVVDTASEEAAAMVDQPSSVLEPQDLEEADVTSAPMTEETQVEDDVPQDLNNTSDDSQITVENVASQIEEECEKEDTAVSVVPEEVLDVHKEAETLDKVGEQTPKIGVTDEISAESFTQHEVRISTPATSENGEPGKSRRAVVRAITAVQSETPRRRSKRHSKLEEGIQEETKTQDGGRTLRRRTVMNTPTPKRKYTRHQKVFEEGENKAEVSEENEVLKTEVVEESAVTEGEEQEEMTTMKEDVVLVEELTEEKQHLEDEQLTDEEKTEKQQGLGLEDTVVKGSSTELPGTTETALTEGDEDEIVIDESEKEQQGDRIQTSVIQDKQDTSDDEVEEPPVVEKRALRGRRKVTPKPKPTKQSKRHQKQAGEHTDEAEEKADEQATDKQMEEHYQVEQEKTVDKTEEEISTDKLIVVEEGALPKTEEAAEDVIPSTEVNMAESREVQEEEGTDGETETVSVIEAEKKKETVSVTGVADDIIQVPDTAASAAATATAAAAAASAAFAASALETEISDSVLSEAVVPATEEPPEKYIGSEIPKLQKATVILVDIKTTCHHLSVKEAEETQVVGESDAPKKQQEEEDGGKGKNITEKSLAATETVEKEELEEDNSEKEKDESASVEISGAEHCTSPRSQQEEEDNLGEGVTDKEADEAETGADVKSASTTETQVEDDVPPDLNNTSDDSQITVENVATQIEEECEKEDTVVQVDPEEVLDVHKEAETLDKVGEQTPKIGVTDEKSAESFTQHKVRISTPATSENGEAGKSRRAVVRAITAVQSETPRQRSKRHSKLEEGIQEDTTAQDGGRTLRRRTVMNTPTPKRKYTRHQKVFEEGENKAEVSEENEVLKTEVVEESAVTEGEEQEEMTTMKEDVVLVEELTEEKQHLEDEQLTDEEKTEKQQGLGLEDTVVKGSSTELPGTAETALTEGGEDEIVIDESEKEQQGDRIQTSVIQDKQDTSDDEVEEPPVVEKRALRGRRKVTPKPKPTKQSKRHQKQAGEHTDEAEEKADEQATDKQMEEHHQVEQEKTVDKTEEEISTDKLIVVEEGALPKTEEAAEDVIPSTEVNMAESREVQEEEGTDGETETVSVIEAEKKKETVSVTGVADDIIQVPDTAASAAATATAAAAAASAAFAASALETEISDSVLSEAVVPATEEPQEKYIGSEIPNLQKATVILVDIKTTCHHLSVKEAEETQVDGESDAPKKQQEEEDGGKGQNTTEKSLAATETVEKEELEEDNSEKEKDESASVEISGAEHCTSTRSQQEEEDNLGEGVTDKEADEAETGADEVEGERESVAKDAVTVTVPAEQSAISEICADREADIPVGEEVEKDLPPAVVDEGMGFEEEETPVVETKSLGRRTKKSMATPTCKSTRSRNQVGAQGAENSEDEPIVTTRTLRRGRISASDTPEGKSRRSRKQIQEEQKGEAESATGVEEEEVAKEAAVVKTDKEMDEKVEEEASESTAILRPSAEEAPPLAEEQQSKDMASQISDLQRVTVLVDMQTTHHDVQEEAAAAEEVSVQKTAAGAENEQREEAMKEEETVGHENVLRSPVAIETTELVEDKGFEDTVKTVRIKDTVEGRAEETAKEDEAESMNDEEQESTVTETRTLRSRKQAVKATPTTKLARSRQSDKSEVEKEAASKVQKEEPAIQERDTTDQAENIEAEMGIEKMDTVAEEPAIQQDAPEEGQDDNTETVADEDTESSAGQHAVEGNTLDAAEEAVTGEGEQCTSSSKVAESAVEQGAQVTLLTARDDEAKCASEEEEAQVMERVLRSDEKTVRATTRSKATKRQDDEQEEETIGEKGTEEDETAVGPRVLRKGRRSAAATPRRKSKRVRTQCPSEEEEETTPSEEKELEGAHTKKKDINSDEKIGEKDGEGAAAQEEETVPEEIQEEETKAVLGETEEKEESNNEKIEEKDGEEAAVHEEETTEPEVEMAKVEAVAEGSIAEQEIAQEEQSAVSETRSDAQGETSAGEMAEETPNADMGKVTEEEPPTVVSGPLRSGTKRRRATTRSKTTRRKEDEQEEETTGEESTEEYEPAVEPRVLRKGRRSAAATPRRKSKRVRTQCPSEEEEETAPPEEKHVEEEGKESPEEKGEELEEERRSIKLEKEKKSIELEKDKYVEEEEVESRARGGSPVVEAEQTQDASTEEAAALEEEGNSVEAVDEIGTELLKISSAEAEETKSAEEEETTVKEKSAATEMGSDTAIADKEALAEDASAVACEEAPAVTRALRGKTKSSHATLSRRSRRRKDQGVLETQQQEDEKLEEEEVHQLTTDSPRRSIRKRQRVDYRENDKEDERAETDAATDEEGEEKLESDEKKDKIAECSADKPIEKVDIFNLVLDTDEEVEPAGKSQEEEDNEQNMSEEEVEPLVIGKRDLRGRSVPSVVITPRSESRRRSATVHKTEESMSDREKSHRSAQKRKGTEATVTRKSKRLSRV